MTPLVQSLIAGGAIVAISAIGALSTIGALGAFISRRLPVLVSFSAGAFIVVSVALLIEGHEMLGSTAPVAAFAALGAGALWLLGRFIPESHHHHEADEPAGAHTRPNAGRMLLGDAIHNIGDGVVLVPAFMIDFHVGVLAALGIAIHEAAQEISEFFVLRAAGFSVREALVKNALVASTLFIGIALGAFASASDLVTGFMLSAAAGAFVFIIAKDLIPHSVAHAQASAVPATYLGAAVLGMAMMAGVQFVTPHTHGHEEEAGHADGAPERSADLHPEEIDRVPDAH